MRFELILVASLMVVVSALPSKNDQCLTVNSQCNINGGVCCDGLKCESDNSPIKFYTCKSHWTTQPAGKGTRDGAVTAKVINAFVKSMFVNPANACYGKGAGCAMVPNGCCHPYNCECDAFGNWSCT